MVFYFEYFLLGFDHDVSDRDSCTDGADLSNTNEFDEEHVNKVEPSEPIETNHVNPSPPQPNSNEKVEATANQENSDAQEDCINLNLEDEEVQVFEEVPSQLISDS